VPTGALVRIDRRRRDQRRAVARGHGVRAKLSYGSRTRCGISG
jgi:hypothetical protein